MVKLHKKTNADATIAVIEVPWDEASRFGIMNTDSDDIITEFEEKPAEPKRTLLRWACTALPGRFCESILSRTTTIPIRKRFRQEHHPEYAEFRLKACCTPL